MGWNEKHFETWKMDQKWTKMVYQKLTKNKHWLKIHFVDQIMDRKWPKNLRNIHVCKKDSVAMPWKWKKRHKSLETWVPKAWRIQYLKLPQSMSNVKRVWIHETCHHFTLDSLPFCHWHALLCAICLIRSHRVNLWKKTA